MAPDKPRKSPPQPPPLRSPDSLPQNLQTLQLLIDQYNDAEDLDERDEVLADIARHPSQEALEFLRLVIKEEPDAYTRCDAECAIVTRTAANDPALISECREKLLGYLQTPGEAYSYCRAAQTLSDAAVGEAEPLLWQAWQNSALKDTPLYHTLYALEVLNPEETARRCLAELEVQSTIEDPSTLDFNRIELTIASLARLRLASAREPLKKIEKAFRASAKKNNKDAAELEEMADLIFEIWAAPVDVVTDDDA